MIFNRINFYLFNQIIKFFVLILFIFISVAWLLQLTRLLTITNFMHIEIISIIFLSFLLLPNLLTVITPFIIIFGLLLCFLKLQKDNELISILSLGLGLKPFKYSLLLFGIIMLSIFSILNFYIAPKIYEEYKIKEYDLRNSLDFNKISLSNFLNLNQTTILDFSKENKEYVDIFLSFNDVNENLVFAKKGNILIENDEYKFQLIDGFKISIDNNNQIEKLEFLNYILKIENQNRINNEIVDKNTLTLYDDINSNNFLNIAFKIMDIFLILFVIIFFYINNLKKLNFNNINIIFFSSICVGILIVNQILKNSEILLLNYLLIIITTICISFLISNIKNKYE